MDLSKKKVKFCQPCKEGNCFERKEAKTDKQEHWMRLCRSATITIASCAMGESKISQCDVGNLSVLSISAIFHNTNDANDGDRDLIKQSNFQFRVVSRNSMLLGM